MNEVMNISTPITMRIMPPKIEDLPARAVPNFLPMITPPRQMMKVTAAITSEQRNASRRLYEEIVKPTESASIEVATP